MPWIEWRISFSLVEKHIYLRLSYVFQKVFLLCKNLTYHLKYFGLESYMLKTVFLWMLEEWAKRDNIYKEDNILDMMNEVFSYMLKCYKNKHLRMYFIPRINLLQHDKLPPKITNGPMKNEVYGLLKELCDQYSINISTETKHESMKKLVYPMLKEFCDKKLIIKIISNSTKIFGIEYSMLHLQRSTFYPTCENDVLQLQLKLYRKFLNEICSIMSRMNNDRENLCHNLYLIWILADKYFSEKGIQFEVLLKYFYSICDFIKEFKNICDSLNCANLLCEPYILYLHCKFSDTSSSFLKQLDLENKKLELKEMLIDGSLDKILYSKVPRMTSNEYLKDSRYTVQLGDKNKSENIENLIRTKFFYTNDEIFDNFVSTINVHYINELIRNIPCNSQRSFFHERLLFHTCEMYNYGFVDSKFSLPTPAVYMLFISQLAINTGTTRTLTSGSEIKMRDGDNWGYIVKEGNGYIYRTFKDRLHNSFLLSLRESKEINSRKRPLACLE